MNTLVSKTKSLFAQGLFHIMGSTVINKIIAFITNIFLVRILTKYDFGVFSSAFNVFLIVSLFTGFGMPSATLYYGSDKEEESTRSTIYLFSLKYGLIVSLVLCLATLVYGLFGNVGIEDTRGYIIGLTFLPLFSYIVDYYAIILRTRKDNKHYAYLLNVNSISYAISAVLGSLLWGISGAIYSRYLAYFLSALIGFWFTRKYIHLKGAPSIDKGKRKEVIKYAAYSGGVSALNNILYRIDITLISVLVADASLLATYKVAAVIPENMNFIPQSILIVFLPLFIENQDNKRWVISKAKELFKNMSIICGSISLVMLVCSDLIIRLFWGDQYLDGTLYFRILAISFFFLGVFRSTSTNILQALGKVKFNFYVSIIASISNIILDVVLINNYSVLGAAIATLSVTIIASLISVPYLINVLKSYKNDI